MAKITGDVTVLIGVILPSEKTERNRVESGISSASGLISESRFLLFRETVHERVVNETFPPNTLPPKIACNFLRAKNTQVSILHTNDRDIVKTSGGKSFPKSRFIR